MRCPRLYTLLLTLFCCGAGHLSLAQRTAVLPLLPVNPTLQSSPAAIAPTVQWSLPAALPVPPEASKPESLLLLNTSMIINSEVLSSICGRTSRCKNIKRGKVYQPTTVPRQWRSLAANDIVDVIVKKKAVAGVSSKTLAEIGEELKLSGAVSYAIDAMPVADASLRIATAAIGEIQVTPATAATPAALVTICIAHPAPAAPRNVPPGPLRVRGAAAF